MKMMKKYNMLSGILLGLIFPCLLFFLLIPSRYFNTSSTQIAISALIKLSFGAAELIFFIFLFDKKHIKNVINFNNSNKALIVSIPWLLPISYALLYIVFFCKGFSRLNFWLIMSIILQQLATGFWEELTFRGYFMQGFIDKYPYRLGYRILCCLLAGAVFGAGHTFECSSLHEAIYRFTTLSIMGISFASIFLYSKNLLFPMIIHAIYDLTASFIQYADYVVQSPKKIFLDILSFPMYGIILIFAIVIIVFPCIWFNKTSR